MKKKQPAAQSRAEFFAAEMARAEKKWQKLTRQPNPVGRPSQRDLDRGTISAIAKVNGGVSGAVGEVMTQAQWITAVGMFKGDVVPGRATIQKHFKEYSQSVPFPLHLFPASLVQAKPLQYQLSHWYATAIGAALTAASGNAVSVPFSIVDALHRNLCAKHVKKTLRLTEPRRQAWIRDQWGRTTHVPLESRKPVTGPRKLPTR